MRVVVAKCPVQRGAVWRFCPVYRDRPVNRGVDERECSVFSGCCRWKRTFNILWLLEGLCTLYEGSDYRLYDIWML